MVWQVLQRGRGLLMSQLLVSIQMSIFTRDYFSRSTFCSLEGSELLPQLQGKLMQCLSNNWTYLEYNLQSLALPSLWAAQHPALAWKRKKILFQTFQPHHILFLSLVPNERLHLLSFCSGSPSEFMQIKNPLTFLKKCCASNSTSSSA